MRNKKSSLITFGIGSLLLIAVGVFQLLQGYVALALFCFGFVLVGLLLFLLLMKIGTKREKKEQGLELELEAQNIGSRNFGELKQIYSAYTYNLMFPIMMVILYVLRVLKISSGFDFLILGIAIASHVQMRKAGFKGRYDVPFILCYIVPVLDLGGTLVLSSINLLNSVGLLIIALPAFLLYIVAIVLFFLNAHAIKKQYPTISKDYKNELALRKQIKK